jgi:hypothetical protein
MNVGFQVSRLIGQDTFAILRVLQPRKLLKNGSMSKKGASIRGFSIASRFSKQQKAANIFSMSLFANYSWQISLSYGATVSFLGKGYIFSYVC